MLYRKIRYYFLILMAGMILCSRISAQGKVRDTVISILALGNAYYPVESPFDSYEGINYSAAKFAGTFPRVRMPVIHCSTEKKPLTRQMIIDAVKSFVVKTVNT